MSFSPIKIPSPTTEILNIPVWGLTLQDFIELTVKLINAKQKVLFTTVNTYSLVVAQNNHSFLKHFQEANVVLPDGIGIVLAARILNKHCPERVSGPEFIGALLPVAAKNGFSVFFLGSTEDVLEQVSANLTKKYSNIKIAGVFSPPFGTIDDIDNYQMINIINEARPDILLVGMTAPKQELWLSRNYEKLNVSFMMGVGAVFDYLSSKKSQPPAIIGRLGLEWAYRLLHSPMHVWKREITIPIFIYQFITKQLMINRTEKLKMNHLKESTVSKTKKKNFSLTIKSYEDGDEKHIIPLFEKVFGKTMGKTESEQHWRWEFLSNPVKPISTMLTWDGERLVGQEAANLLRVCVKGKEHLGLLIFDTMTDPEYEGLGIFTATAKTFYKQLADKGYLFVFGFPNANVIHARIKKLDWHIISPTPIYIRPLDIGDFIKNKTKSELLGKLASKVSKKILSALHNCKSENHHNYIEIHKENSFNIWADELWIKCRDHHNLWVIRDFKYLSWRYDLRPETQYELFTAWVNNDIAGYVITSSQLRDEGKISFILDILVDIKVQGVVEALLKTVIQSSIENNVAMISTMIMPKSVYRPAFLKFLFIPLPQKLFPQEIYFGGRRLNNQISSEIFYSGNSWHISWGDTDLL